MYHTLTSKCQTQFLSGQAVEITGPFRGPELGFAARRAIIGLQQNPNVLIARQPAFHLLEAADGDEFSREVLEKAGVSELTRNFVGVVAKNRRLFALDGMCIAFRDLLASRRGEMTAEVASAQPLT
ncbi:MAG: hypothetical protein EBU57_14125, partial [Alphaproteobacteria bacterium]|nr:hypothetical protein [Alphaproteobacteria bacterium]